MTRRFSSSPSPSPSFSSQCLGVAPMTDAPITEWLDDLAAYFETRDTGEELERWLNVYNAENARKVKAALSLCEAKLTAAEKREAKVRTLVEAARLVSEAYEITDNAVMTMLRAALAPFEKDKAGE